MHVTFFLIFLSVEVNTVSTLTPEETVTLVDPDDYDTGFLPVGLYKLTWRRLLLVDYFCKQFLIHIRPAKLSNM